MRRELLFGSTMLVFSAVYYWMADRIPPSQLADAVGPQGLPKIYALALAALSLISMVTAARRRPLQTSDVRPPSPTPRSRSRISGVAGMLLIGVAYVLVVPWLGYPLSIAGVILATAYYQGGAVTRYVGLVAVCGGVFFWLLFVVLMGIQQPSGWWY